MASGSMKQKPQDKYVYVIIDGSGATKIGISDDPKKRLMELQVGSSIKLVLAYSIAVPYALASRIESQIHRSMKHLHLSGEWFFIDPTIAFKAISDLIAGPDKIEERRADKWAKEFWGTKVTCPQCKHWRVVRKPKKELIGKKFRCSKCDYLI